MKIDSTGDGEYAVIFEGKAFVLFDKVSPLGNRLVILYYDGHQAMTLFDEMHAEFLKLWSEINEDS